MLDNLLREGLFTHSDDHVVGQLRPGSDLIEERIDLRRETGVLYVAVSPAPTPVVQLTPTVNESQDSNKAFMGESVVHGGDRTG
ncbi:hypothetical protein BL254_23940 [Protofrankia sp. BMG5.30]|uniref:Uncharacterized protein n=1 Tax=Protofrankia coriariae TaxID=1562887 RepID=A0ABR5F7E1_9ACTN|nr:hypothetical protein FrCorBMG51_04705 [Protofrankia coriariae]ONH30707.1 hypothetical protein BL254_23940 [Protofrankia sp. BMG5.30]